MFLGVPFNIFSYTVLLYILCGICDMRPGDLVVSLGDTHVYLDHLVHATEMLERMPFTSPRLEVRNPDKSLKLYINNFILQDYQHHPKIQANMSI